MAGRENLQPAQPGNKLALKHGATSDAQIRPRAANHRRRFLRQKGLRLADIDPIGRGLLDLYARTASKLDLADAYIEAHGMLKPNGEPQPVMRLYVSLANSARLALVRLEAHLRTRTGDPVAALNSYLDATYSEEDDAEPAA